LSAFRARTGRNQPSNSKFIFGPAVWIRSLIKPPSGYGVAYIDWAQQEFGIAAYLSSDPNMIAAYLSGDPYLAFGKQVGLIPPDGTKHSHKFQRELCKQCILAVLYGMGEVSLAARIGQPAIVARGLLRAHRENFCVFWRWSDGALDTAMLTNVLHTTYGWHVHVGEDPNPRSLRNFIVQGNGAEMMRIAACLGTERGVEVCAPVHDAFLICAPLDRLDADIATMRQAMAEASRAVLAGFEIGTDVSVVKFPGRYMDERGTVMWAEVMNLLSAQALMRATA
jgi:DNA polymerase I-like protein with 3'-5' exonuclease and polymerase domains